MSAADDRFTTLWVREVVLPEARRPRVETDLSCAWVILEEDWSANFLRNILVVDAMVSELALVSWDGVV